MNLLNNRSMRLAASTIAVSSIAGLLNPTAASAVILTYESPNVFSASPSVGTTAQNNFESPTTGNKLNYTYDFIEGSTNYRATYDNLFVANYGSGSQTAGAGYTGKFAVNTRIGITNPAISTTNINFTNTDTNTSAGIKYFGLFVSSLDARNQLTFFNGSTQLAQLSLTNFATLVNNTPGFVGGPYGEPGAFFNFFAEGAEEFTRIEFTQKTLASGNQGGFESDNHTFRFASASALAGNGVNLSALTYTGNVNTISVPEPFTVIGTLVGGTAALRLRKKLKSANQ
jgi:hypothetical protein